MKRWILALAIALAVAVALVGAYWWSLASSRSTPGNAWSGGCPPCGAPLALGAPRETNSSLERLYNFSVESGGGGLVWNNLNFEIQRSTGSSITTSGPGWGLTIFDLYGRTVATYGLESTMPAWTSGGASAVTSQDCVLLAAPSSVPLHGDSLLVEGTGSFSGGSVTVLIP